MEAKPRSSSPAAWASFLTSHMGSVFPTPPQHLGNRVAICARTTIPAQSLHGATSGSTHSLHRLVSQAPAAPPRIKNRSYDCGPRGTTGYPREVTAKESKGLSVRTGHSGFRNPAFLINLEIAPFRNGKRNRERLPPSHAQAVTKTG